MIAKARPFGLTLSSATAAEIAEMALTSRRDPPDGVALVVTPNIEHIARLRSSPALARAYRNAAVTVCDGWPVRRYARLCGLQVERVTGCDVTVRVDPPQLCEVDGDVLTEASTLRFVLQADALVVRVDEDGLPG